MINLKQKFLNGVFYTGISKYLGLVVTLLIGILLARLLSPEEFGLVALVSVFIAFFNLLCDFGIASSIVQNKDLNEEDIISIFIFTIFLGSFFTLIFYHSSNLISSFFNEKELVNIVNYLSFSVFFTAINIVPTALLHKTLQFKLIGIITFFVELFSGLFAVLLAYNDYGVYSLVFKSIAKCLLMFFLFYYYSPIKFVFKLNLISLKKISKFSFYQLSFNLINFFARNMDNLLIGKYFNTTSLGIYDISYKLMKLPVQNLTSVLSPVIQPILSVIESDKSKIFNTYLKLVKILAFIGFPISAFFYFSSTEIIYILYGNKWIESIPIFKLLSITVGFQVVLSSSGSIFQSINRPDLLFISGCFTTISMLLGICYGVFISKTLTAIAFLLIISFALNFFVCFYILIVIGLNNSYHKFLKSFLNPIAITILLSGFLFGINFLNVQSLHLSLILKIITSLLICLFSFFIIEETRELFYFSIKKFLNKSKLRNMFNK